MEKGKITDLVAVGFCVLLALATAYITFGILESQASTKNTIYSLGGAIAGALISFSLFFSAYKQLVKSTGEVEKLRKQVQELNQKLLKGAPCPPDFETEVDERQRIVLAKPGKWEPRGGTIFDFELPKEKLRADDVFPARLQVLYGPVKLERQTLDEYYEKTKRTFESPFSGSWSSEYIHIGGEPNSIKSLKIICELFGKIVVSKNPLTGKDETFTQWLRKDEFDSALAANIQVSKAPVVAGATKDETPVAEPAPAGTPPASETGSVFYRKIWWMQVASLHERLGVVFIFNFYDDEHDFTDSSALFNQVLASVRFLT